MKKVLLVALSFLVGFGVLGYPATASELDDKRVANLFSVATKTRSYGDFCWEVKFTGEWEIPKGSAEPSDFKFYAMEMSALNRPKGVGDFGYGDFRKQFVRTLRAFKPNDRALVICLPNDFSFEKYLRYGFMPWIDVARVGTNKTWLFIKNDGKIYAKPNWRRFYGWLTGVKAIQDFICLGANDPNVLKVEGNTITFKPRDDISFRPEDVKDLTEQISSGKAPLLNQFFSKWQDDKGANIQGSVLKAGQTYTLTFTGDNPMPKGW
ncbi:hypothetical protein FACS1894204_10360 [Synergistales bacterium]|nr:hypothetical protein FACS1894204_10360 [Synergistales bacterium]